MNLVENYTSQCVLLPSFTVKNGTAAREAVCWISDRQNKIAPLTQVWPPAPFRDGNATWSKRPPSKGGYLYGHLPRNAVIGDVTRHSGVAPNSMLRDCPQSQLIVPKVRHYCAGHNKHSSFGNKAGFRLFLFIVFISWLKWNVLGRHKESLLFSFLLY